MATLHSLRLLAYLVLATLFAGVLGQHSDVKCTNKTLDFATNSLGQSPCLVAAYLSAVCSSDGDFNVPPIQPGTYYTPPSDPTACLCSTVTYSLTSACAACQNADISRWSLFHSNCSKTAPDGSFPLNIPPGTAVPAWAFQLVNQSNSFDVQLAAKTGGYPERKAAATTSSSSSAGSTSSSGVPPTRSSPAPAASNTSSGGGTNVGAIAGGVVGGVAGVGLIGGLLAFFLLRRSKEKQRQEVSQYNQHYTPQSQKFGGTPPGTSHGPTSPGFPPQPTSPGFAPENGYVAGAPIHAAMMASNPFNTPNASTASGTERPNSMAPNPQAPMNDNRMSLASSPASAYPTPIGGPPGLGSQSPQMGYPQMGHQPQPSLQGTSVNERPYDPNFRMGSANEPDRVQVY